MYLLIPVLFAETFTSLGSVWFVPGAVSGDHHHLKLKVQA